MKVTILFPVYHVEAWQRNLTECALRLMHECTEVPFEVICVERVLAHPWGFPDREPEDVYLRTGDDTCLVQDLNAAIRSANGEFLVHTANDIFVRPGWLEALLEPFEKYPDCGVSTLAADELNMQPVDRIFEGVYGPIMMFRKSDRASGPDNICLSQFDPAFQNIFSDTDLIMRHYEAGLRSYRNWKVVVNHLNKITWSRLSQEEQQKRFNAAKELFIQRHKDSPFAVFRALVEGHVI